MTLLAQADHPGRPTRAKSLTLAAMSLGYSLVQLDVTIVNTALNSVGTALGGGIPELQWVVSSYTIAFAALILHRRPDVAGCLRHGFIDCGGHDHGRWSRFRPGHTGKAPVPVTADPGLTGP